MHDGMPYGRNQGQGQGHSREVDRQSPTGLILFRWFAVGRPICVPVLLCFRSSRRGVEVGVAADAVGGGEWEAGRRTTVNAGAVLGHDNERHVELRL